ncbi:hypothetical protein GSI_10081 [Ganoderma sinense ZZ0214-1]|uniref:Uncharacterized protein n=1 Tax=Ganoderma sinense ZZ0214-1 TaxID=1077348 RepID=A0A2G8RZJ7_9APHY|nr:hypothetical protein GSI_10081 [Ganoderma sinense ZZ0214-1]
MSGPWPGGYADVQQDADPCHEDVHYAGQLVVSATHPSTGPVPSIFIVEHLEQGANPCKQSVKGTPASSVCFNDWLGVSLGLLATLENGWEPAFDVAANTGENVSIRFKFSQFPGRSIQVRGCHGDNKRRDGRRITVREMRDMAFDVLKKLMDHGKVIGTPLQHRGDVVDIERVVLLRVDQVFKGSIQPILGIRSNG